jgi:uncharacterized protein (DUF736 family)
MQFPSKSQRHSSQRLKNINPKVYLETRKRLWIVKTILSKKSNLGGITIPDFKLHYRSIAIKTAWHNRYEDQWNRIPDPDMNSVSYAHLIFDKGAKNIQWRKEPLQQMLLGKLDICLQNTETRSLFVPCISTYQLKVD